jgi:Ni,Fe-hydrogenase III small subunit
MSEFSVARQAAVWVLPLESGGCGATLQSIFALQAPRYAAELRAAGVSFARSPRHADIVLIAGPLSQTAREPFARMLAAVPQPRALVAVGNCAIDGCVFAASPHITAHPAEELDAHVEVGGCPPAPSAILAAIVEAKRLLAGRDDTSDAQDENDDEETAAAMTSEAAAGEDDEA